MHSRTLTLKKDTLHELTGTELASVAGGAATQVCTPRQSENGFTCLTGMYPTTPVQTCLCDILN